MTSSHANALETETQDGHADSNITPGLTVDLRTERSLLTYLVQTCIKPFRPRLVRPKKYRDAGSPQLSPPRKARKRCDVKERKVDGIFVYDLVAKEKLADRADRPSRNIVRRIYYFAGGGWRMPPSNDHWALGAEIACRIPNTTFTLISIPLAPSNPASVSFPQIAKTYDTLITESFDKGEQVTIAGDSSGGNIALCLTAWSLEGPEHGGLRKSVRAPAAVLAICPTTDLRHDDPSIKDIAKLDPILTFDSIFDTARAWCAATKPDPDASDTKMLTTPNPEKKDDLDHTDYHLNWGPDDPRVSPIRADLAPLVEHGIKIHGITAGYDVLGPEAVVFREKCKSSGIQGEWLEWQKQMHCFPLAFKYGLRESREAVNWMADVLSRI